MTGTTIEPRVLSSYAAAVKAMLKLPPTDPRNWYRQAMIHVIDCPHRNWWFLPWHRAYLHHFEQICRELSGDEAFALPFWDWTAAPRIPPQFVGGQLDPSGADFLDGPAAFGKAFAPAADALWRQLDPGQVAVMRRRLISGPGDLMAKVAASVPARSQARTLAAADAELPDFAKQEVAEGRIADIMTVATFEQFGSDRAGDHLGGASEGLLESSPHDNVHGAVGGYMGRFMSPVDPLFWLHHANLDRLWAVWAQRRKAVGAPGAPPDAAWAKERFLFFADRKGRTVSVQSGDYRDVAAGYEPASGSDLPLAASRASGQTAPFRSSRITVSRAGFSEALVNIPQSVTGLSTIALDISGLSGTSANSFTTQRLPANPAGTPRPLPEAAPPGVSRAVQVTTLLVRLTVTPPPDSDGATFLVFANCPYLSADTPASDPHYVGAIRFFGLAHHGGGSITYSFPLDRTVARLPTGSVPAGGLTIQVVSRGSGRPVPVEKVEIISA